MSFDLVALVWASRGLSSTEKLVLLRIADRVNVDSGVAYPSVQSLADDCALTKSGTVKVLNRLREKGCLAVEAGTGRRSSHYRVHLEPLPSGEPRSPLGEGAEARSGEQGSPLDEEWQDLPDPVVVNRVAVVVNGVHRSGERRSPESLRTIESRKIKSTAASRRRARRAADPSEGTFGLYSVIAREARRHSLEVDASDDLANILEIFKTLCAQRSLTYDGELAARAVHAIVHVRAERPFTEREWRDARDWYRKVGTSLDRDVSSQAHMVEFMRRRRQVAS